MIAAPPDLHGRPVAAETEDQFLAAYGHLFEHSPWVVARAWARRPFADAEALHAAFMTVLAHASRDERLALARAHPELADRLAIAQGLTESSAKEQASAGLDRLSPQEYALFSGLNRAYRERHGFPFIVCVKLNDRASILAAMRARVAGDSAAELDAAIAQVGLISRLRLADMTPDPLAELTQTVRRDLEVLDLPRDWVKARRGPSGERALDVIIVGGGHSGLGAAYALIREGVSNILVLDENPAGQEGPWITYARMMTLRTPKQLTGLDMGVPSLTFRAFWEAQYRAEAWAAMDKIPRRDWMRYLKWFRAALRLPVRNGMRVTAVGPAFGGLHRVTATDIGGETQTLLARKVVLATGIQGGGEWHTPGFIKSALPASRYAHTSQAIDFHALKGKRIGLLGGGASAFDNAHFALTEGVGEVHVFMRRAQLPRVNPIRHMEISGLTRQFPHLDDGAKYRVIRHFLDHAQPPTNDTFGRAAALPGFHLHLGAGWRAVRETSQGVEVTTEKGVFTFDFLILSTGLITDMALRPELRDLAGDIALWRDRYQPPAGEAHALLDDHPYLGPYFELTGRSAEGDARLHGLFLFNYAALASLGLSASALSGLRAALPRLATGIARQLFLDDQDALLDAFLSYDEAEFIGQWPAS